MPYPVKVSARRITYLHQNSHLSSLTTKTPLLVAVHMMSLTPLYVPAQVTFILTHLFSFFSTSEVLSRLQNLAFGNSSVMCRMHKMVMMYCWVFWFTVTGFSGPSFYKKILRTEVVYFVVQVSQETSQCDHNNTC